MNRDTVLSAVTNILTARGANYGDAYINHKRIGDLWSVILGKPVAPHEVALCMAALKIARLVESKHHADSWIDLAGYAAIGAECVEPNSRPTEGR